MSYLKRVFYACCIFFILLATLLAFLFTTTPGLYTTVQLANLVLPGKVKLHKATGRLLHHFAFKELTYADDTIHVEFQQGDVRWRLSALFHRQLGVELTANKLLVTPIKPSGIPKLPFTLKLNKFSINEVEIHLHQKIQHFEKFELQGSLTNDRWIIDFLKLNLANFHFSLRGSGLPGTPYTAAGLLEFEPLTKHTQGLQGNIKIDGDYARYHWQGQLKGPMQGTFEGTLKNGTELHTDAEWQYAQWPINAFMTLKSNKGHLTLNGVLSDFIINATSHLISPLEAEWQIIAHVKSNQTEVTSTLHLPQGRGDVKGTLEYNEQTTPKYKGEVYGQELDLSTTGFPLHHLAFKSQFFGNSPQTLDSDTELTADYLTHLLRANINYTPAAVDAKVTLGANMLRLNGTLPYQWQAKISIPQPQYLHPSLVGLQTTISANARLRSPQDATFTLNVSPGIYRLPEENNIPPIKFKGGQLSANITPQALRAHGAFNIDPYKTLNLSLYVPKLSLSALSKARNIDGKLNLQINSLDFLQSLNSNIDKVKGQFQMSLIASGALKKPVIKGELLLKNGSFTVPKSGLTFSAIQAKLQSGNKQWQAQGSIAANGHTLTLKGQGYFSPQVTGKLNITGENFPVVKTQDYNINVSPQLAVNFNPTGVNLTGSVLVPSAQLKPISYSNTVSLSGDVVFVRKKPATTNPLHLTTDVQIQMGKDVTFDVKGLRGSLDGAFHVKQSPQSPLTAVGELLIRDGKYKAYGQDLIIDQGQLLFTGGPIDNPEIHIRAIRKFSANNENLEGSNQLLDFSAANIETFDLGSQTTVGIEITGHISSHKIKLFSMPPTLSQSDILSMLLLGKPANQASRSGGQLLLTAISSMNLDTGTKGLQLLDQLKQSLGVDINVQNNPRYTQTTNQTGDNTTLVVSKSLSKRVYISYNIGLLDQNNSVITLKYLLNKFFSIQVTTSDAGNGVDVLYTRGN